MGEKTPQSFQKAREKVFEEKGHECIICGRGHDYSPRQDLSVHHINGDRSDNRLENLIPVCQRCHLRIHRRDEEPYREYHRQLPEDDRHTPEYLVEIFSKRKETRNTGDRTVVNVSWRAAERAPADTPRKFEVSGESELERMVSDWNDSIDSGQFFWKPAHPGNRDTEITHTIGYMRPRR